MSDFPRSAHPGEEITDRTDPEVLDAIVAAVSSKRGIAEEPGERKPTMQDTSEAEEWLVALGADGIRFDWSGSVASLAALLARVRSEGGGEGAEALKILRGLHTPGCENWRLPVANCCEGNDRWLAQFSAPSGEKGWQPIETAKGGVDLVLLFADGRAAVCYRADNEPPLASTWRYSHGCRGEQAPWPIKWAPLPPLPEPPKEVSR